ncbi:hypothetical protein GCM10023113_36450 [Cellulomonas oligotrophica]
MASSRAAGHSGGRDARRQGPGAADGTGAGVDVRGRTVRGAAAAGAVLLALVACTSTEPEHDRADDVVVAVGSPFLSLNAGTAAGLAPGSTLVRGLVQSGFTSLEEDGSVVADPSFGTVEVVDDEPFTVRYTIAETARWSDGVPVTPADLLLEWAARSGQLDEVVPEIGADGLPVDPAALDDVVAFAATSPALVHATAVPRVDGATVTVVHDRRVADWQVALDVNLPAHVVGRLALDPAAQTTDDPAPTGAGTVPPTDGPTPGATATGAAPGGTATGAPATTEPAPGADPTAVAADAARWAGAVQTAVEEQDRDALVDVARVWRAAGTAGDVATDPVLTTTTGPYVLAQVDDDGVLAVPNDAYAGAAPAAYASVRVRTDLDPLAQVDAVSEGGVDVAAPLSTGDVLAAAAQVEGATVLTGGDAVLQLVLQEGGGGVFDAAASSAGQATAARAAFVATVPREEVVTRAAEPLWGDATVSDEVLAEVALGPLPSGEGTAATAAPTAAAPTGTATATQAPTAPGADGLVVRLLANTDDPVRAEALEVVTSAAADAGIEVVVAEVEDPAAALRTEPEAWDAALVPVAQEALGVSAAVARWRTDGATNVTGHADDALDEAVDALDRAVDADARADALGAVAEGLRASGAVLPLVRTPALTLVRDSPVAGLPTPAGVPLLPPARADLTSWWGWVRG